MATYLQWVITWRETRLRDALFGRLLSDYPEADATHRVN